MKKTVRRNPTVRAGLQIAVALLFGCGLGLWALVASETGSRWILHQLAQRIPALQIEGSHGSLRDGLSIGSVGWRDTDYTVDIQDLRISIHWRSLFHGKLEISELASSNTSIELPEAAPSPQTPRIITLPALNAPLPILLQSLTLKRLQLKQASGDTNVAIHLKKAQWRSNLVSARSLALSQGDNHIQTSGQITLTDNYPIDLKVKVNSPSLQGKLDGKLQGSLAMLQVDATLAGEWPLQIQGNINALQPALPFKLQAKSAGAMTLKSGEQPIIANTARLELSGQLDQFDGELNTAITEAHFGNSRLTTKISRRGDSLTLDPIQWQITSPQENSKSREPAHVALHCNALLDTGSWQCAGGLQSIPLDSWIPGQRSRVSAKVSAAGSWKNFSLHLAANDINAMLGAESIRGDLQLQTADGQNWQLPELHLDSNGNHLQASGQFGKVNRLHLGLDAPALQHIHPSLAGSLRTEVVIEGQWPRPNVQGEWQGKNLKAGAYSLKNIIGQLQLPELGNAGSSLQIKISGLSVATDSADGWQIVQGNIDLNGNRKQQLLRLGLSDQSGNTIELNCNQQGDINFTKGLVLCTAPRGYVALDDRSQLWEADDLKFSWAREQPEIAVDPFCLRVSPASLCLNTPLVYRHEQLDALSADIRELPLAWSKQFLPRQIKWDDSSRAALNLQLNSIRPLNLNARLDVPAAAWLWTVEDETHHGEFHDFVATVEMDSKRAALKAAAQSSDIGVLDASLEIGDPMAERRLNGELNLTHFQFGQFAWLAPQLNRLSGEADARLRLGGTATKPSITGELHVRDGAMETPVLAEALESINIDAQFDRENIRLDGRFALGGGKGAVNGNIALHPGGNWQMITQLKADDITVTPMPDSSITLSSILSLKADPVTAKLSGKVDINSATLLLKELPPDTQDISDDAEIIGESNEGAPYAVSANLDLNLGDDFNFSGFGADVKLAGKLHLLKPADQNVSASGEVRVSEGRYRAYGQRLKVRTGSFLFDGPMDNPDLQLEALREMPPGSDVVVGVRVDGPLQNPNAELFSEPPRPETETAYYLLTGRPPSQFGQGTQMSAESALLAVGLAGTNKTAGKYAERIGIKDFEIGTADSEQGTEAQISGYLSPRLYVRYGTGIAQRTNTVTFQYRLTNKLLLEAVSGLEQALDLMYSFSIE